MKNTIDEEDPNSNNPVFQSLNTEECVIKFPKAVNNKQAFEHPEMNV